MSKKLAIVAVFACVLAMQCRNRGQNNLVLITIDTLRADHLGCYGYPKNTSPTIDSVAQHGILFVSTMAQRGQTWPSLTSILTSMYPQTHGVRENGDQLDASKVTLPEILKAHGYTTAAALTNMQTAPNRGFDAKLMKAGPLKFRDTSIDSAATESAISWLRQNRSKPFFLWVHYLAPHRPYMPPPPFDQRFANNADALEIEKTLKSVMLNKTPISKDLLNDVIGLYDGEVAFIDDEIRKLMNEIDSTGLKNRTLVIITADHGEELYDRNSHFGHGCSIYDSVLHIPLILRLPNMLPENVKIGDVVQSIDITPTLLDLLGIKKPSDFEGKSLTNLIFRTDQPQKKGVAYSEIRDKIASIRTDQWRYVFNPENIHPPMLFPVRPRYRKLNEYFIGTEEIYYLPNDPDEHSNVLENNRAVAEQMKAMIQEWRKRAKGPYNPKELDEKTREELKALGYVQ